MFRSWRSCRKKKCVKLTSLYNVSQWEVNYVQRPLKMDVSNIFYFTQSSEINAMNVNTGFL